MQEYNTILALKECLYLALVAIMASFIMVLGGVK